MRSESLRHTEVPFVSEWEWNGQYEEGSPSDQREMHMRWLHVLKTAEAFVSVLGHPYAFPVKVEQVVEVWKSPAAKWEAGEAVKRLIASRRPYAFSPESPGSPPAGDPVPDAVVDETPPDEDETEFGY